MDNIIPENTPEKQCSKCKKFFPATLKFFCRAKIQKDGLRPECKVCKKAQADTYRLAHPDTNKQYYQAHKEEMNEQSRHYHATHRETIKANHKRWCQLHREEQIIRRRRYYQFRKDQILLSAKRYYGIHKEDMLRKHREYRNAHIEEYRMRDRQYSESHREQKREYYRKNREHASIVNRRRYLQHTEEARERTRQWRERHPEYGPEYDRRRYRTEQGRLKSIAKAHKRYMRKREIEGTLTGDEIQAKLKAQKYACYYCFKKFKCVEGRYIFHLEHTIPVSRTEHSPRHDVNYVVLACPHCNHVKSNKLPHEWGEGGRLF